MKTVASAAGVTAATVSLALRNNPRIPSATRKRIHAIAKKVGYVPDPYVSRLMRLRRNVNSSCDKPVLALVCAQNTEEGWRNHHAPTIRAMLKGAIDQASARGYSPQEFWLQRDGMSHERFSDVLYARGIHGVIVGPRAEGSLPVNLRWQHFAAVSLSVPLENAALTTVSNDHYNSSLRVARECLRRGYRRLGLILKSEHKARFDGRWEAGVLAALNSFGSAPLIPWLYLTGKDDAEDLGRWLRKNKPDALITTSTEVIPDLIGTLARHGRRVPEDLGIAVLACPHPGSKQSGIFQNGELIGASAVDVVISLLERFQRGPTPAPQSLLIQGSWNEGETLPPR